MIASGDVQARWAEPSALVELTVGALVSHFSAQITRVVELMEGPAISPRATPIDLVGYYTRTGPAAPTVYDLVSLAIRRSAENRAVAGGGAIAESVRSALEVLGARLLFEQPSRLVRLFDATLRLDDAVLTRLVEVVVHADDLAASVGLPPPRVPDDAADLVVASLARLARSRHGTWPVVRNLARVERSEGLRSAF